MTALCKTPVAPVEAVPFAIRAERASDAVAREVLLDACFGENRHMRTCQRLRNGRAPAEGLALSALRQGRLVDEGTLAELRHLSAQTVDVTFAGAAPELEPLEGVTVEHAGPNALRFEVSGSVGPLLDALAGKDVVGLTSREPSLEEIFLHHYGAVDVVST